MQLKIKKILDEIASEGSTNRKMAILAKYKNNELLKKVIYQAKSKRIKFYVKQIPQFLTNKTNTVSLDYAISQLEYISNRTKTGHEALNHLRGLLASMDIDDAYVLERIIDRDLKIGMGTTNINKIFPDLIERTPYMGAISFDADRAKSLFKDGPCFSQVKMDGRYCNAIIRGGEVEMESRGGEPTVLSGCKFEKELENLDDCVLNGEITMDSIERKIILGKNDLIEVDDKVYNYDEFLNKFS